MKKVNKKTWSKIQQAPLSIKKDKMGFFNKFTRKSWWSLEGKKKRWNNNVACTSALSITAAVIG